MWFQRMDLVYDLENPLTFYLQSGDCVCVRVYFVSFFKIIYVCATSLWGSFLFRWPQYHSHLLSTARLSVLLPSRPLFK